MPDPWTPSAEDVEAEASALAARHLAGCGSPEPWSLVAHYVLRSRRAAVQAEREACAGVGIALAPQPKGPEYEDGWDDAIDAFAAAIRARTGDAPADPICAELLAALKKSAASIDTNPDGGEHGTTIFISWHDVAEIRAAIAHAEGREP